MRLAAKSFLIVVVVLVLMQFVRPSISSSPTTSEIQVPPEVRGILNQKCYSCHSNERRLSWFDEIQPGYWLVRNDILTARSRLNFSTLGSQPAAVQKATLYEAVNMIQLGAMPLSRFLALHPDARVTAPELTVLKSYLSPWPNQTDTAEAKASPNAVGVPMPMVGLAEAPPEHNGLIMDPGIGDWKLISVTDRGDNNTLRLILGNEIAMRAIHSGNILPWPDGAKIAKVAWQKQRGAHGMVVPGKFVQIELMAKDAQVYRMTEGWGWGRWRGPTLQPYGASAAYVQECTGCHMPVKGNDNVYTLPISQAKVDRQEIVNNAAAALPVTLPYHPLGWTPITMSVDPSIESVAVLFGNDLATRQIRNYSKGHPEFQMSYPEGSVLALVTWRQRDDPHWFGARIPSDPETVEFLIVGAKAAIGYERFQGGVLSPASENAAVSNERTNLILGLVPAQFPH